MVQALLILGVLGLLVVVGVVAVALRHAASDSGAPPQEGSGPRP